MSIKRIRFATGSHSSGPKFSRYRFVLNPADRKKENKKKKRRKQKKNRCERDRADWRETSIKLRVSRQVISSVRFVNGNCRGSIEKRNYILSKREVNFGPWKLTMRASRTTFSCSLLFFFYFFLCYRDEWRRSRNQTFSPTLRELSVSL